MSEPKPSHSDQAPEPLQIAPERPVVESASASTACQTNTSKFAYILTGSVLGVLALIAVAITLLAFAVIDTTISSYDNGYFDNWDEDWNDDWDEDWEDELEEFENHLWSEHPTHSTSLRARYFAPSSTSSRVTDTSCGVGTQSTLKKSAAIVSGM